MLEQPTILYIEDNPDNRRLVQRVLEARGFRVLLADDGPAGIAAAAQSGLALVLVDINIPALDGYETTTRLRAMQHLRSTPIVALTADVQSGTRERSLAAGCDGYISKPIDPRLLPAQVQEFIDGKRELLPEALQAHILREYSQKLVRRLEQQVQEVTAANRELQELDRLKSQFIATVSHELRTPLTSIVGYVDLFEKGTLGQLTEPQQEAIGVIARNAQTLARQLNSLIYLQEVRASQVKRAPFLVHELLRRVAGELQGRAALGQVLLQQDLHPTALFYGDAPGLEHALWHVVDNAIKFTPAGGRVRVSIADTPAQIVVQVQDTGIGIPPEALAKIFQPFFQVDTSLGRANGGVGVGLSLVKHVMDAHGGHVQLRSTLGKGSIVTLTLPRAKQ